MENKEKKKKDDWIRLASKSRPGRFYMFNKATGETLWLPLKKGEDDEDEQDAPPKISISKSSKTPAQDRLKRLQHNLKITQTRSHASRNARPSSDVEVKAKHEQENQINDLQPSTSSAAISARKAIKRPQNNEMDNLAKSTKTSDEVKKLRLSDTSNSIASSINTSESGTVDVSESIKTLPNNKQHLQNVEENNSSTLNNLRTGIVKKIKEICKIPFNVSKKIAEDKTNAKIDKSSALINTNQFKATARAKDHKRLSLTSAQEEAIVSQIREENYKSLNSGKPTNSLEFNTPKNLNIPCYPRGSANSRLERLKQSLLSQHQEQKHLSDTTNDHKTSDEKHNLSLETNNNNTTTLLQLKGDSHNDTSVNSLFHTANNTINNDEVEAMDWQPIVKEEDTLEITKNEQPTLIIEKSKKLVVRAKDANGKETMGDIYDTVNNNLSRFSAEKQKESTNSCKKWRKDFYYFIVDTNVLLRDLTFVEDLTKMKLCDTKGSILYIPYSVLQELDKLKMRSGSQEGVKTLAVRAIKYLNGKFENNSPHVQAQSALDERQRLVDINSADDSIMNCCLQAKAHVPNLLLLTEDVNLRNKAICNNILVSTKSDLVAKRYNSNDMNDKS